MAPPAPSGPTAGPFGRRGRRLAALAATGLGLAAALVLGEAALVLGEAALRLLVPGPAPPSPDRGEPHPRGLYRIAGEGLWTLTPGFDGPFVRPEFHVQVRANRLGLRDRDRGPKPEGGVRIVGLGDSFGFGWGVEEEQGLFRLLEAELGSRPGLPPVEVVNAAIPGYGTFEALQMLERVALALEPDLVILAFYEGNDYRNNLDAPRHRYIVDGYLADAPARPRPTAWGRLVGASRLAGLLDQQWRRVETKRGLAAGVDRTRRYLTGMHELLRGREVGLVLVVIPDQDAAVYRRSGLLRWTDRLLGGTDWLAARAALERHCRDQGIAYLRLPPAFERAAGSAGLRLGDDDVHFNADGHALAARAIADFLARDGLVARPPPGRGGSAP